MGNIKKTATASLKMRKLISDEPSHWIDEAVWYSENDAWLEKSAIIALNILTALRKQSIPKTIFAKMIGVSPQYARKILKGKANLTLKTIVTIEKTLGITLQEIPAHKNSRINKKGSNSVYKLSEFQIQRIEQAREQIRNGQGIPDEEVQAEVECLLDPRPLSKEDKQKISEFINEDSNPVTQPPSNPVTRPSSHPGKFVSFGFFSKTDVG
ncbi:MAG: helix-turn-helix domain-containing protein [Bacteroidales bacterium]